MNQRQKLLHNDKMSFAGLWRLLVDGWRLLLVGLLVAFAIAGTFLSVVQSKGLYEADLVVGLGQFEHDGRVGEIESIGDVINRMQNPDFRDAVVRSLGWQDDEHKRLFDLTYKVARHHDNQLMIRVSGLSQDTARLAAEACVANLANIHSKLAEKMSVRGSEDLARVRTQITDTEEIIHGIESVAKNASPNDNRWIAEWLNAWKDQKVHLNELRMRENVLKVQGRLIKHTMAVEPINISSHKTNSKPYRVLVFAAICGLFLGVLLVSLRLIIRMNKANRPPAT